MPAAVIEQIGTPGEHGGIIAVSAPVCILLDGEEAVLGDILLAVLGSTQTGGQLAGDYQPLPDFDAEVAVEDSQGNTWHWLAYGLPTLQDGAVAVLGCRVESGKELRGAVSAGDADTISWKGTLHFGGGYGGCAQIWVLRCRGIGFIPIAGHFERNGGSSVATAMGVFGNPATVNGSFLAVAAAQVARGTPVPDGCAPCTASGISGHIIPTHPTDPDPPTVISPVGTGGSSNADSGVDISAANGYPVGTAFGFCLKLFLMWARASGVSSGMFADISVPPVGIIPGTNYHNLAYAPLSLYAAGSWTVRVIDPCTGLPVWGIEIQVHRGIDYQADVFTDSNGEYVFASLDDGTYFYEIGPNFSSGHGLPGVTGTVDGSFVILNGDDVDAGDIEAARPQGCPGGVGGGSDPPGAGVGLGIDCAEMGGINDGVTAPIEDN